MDYFEIGQRIRKYRRAQGLSQETLAEKVNISTTHMSHIETGSTKLSLQVLADLAQALKVSADMLLFDVQDRNDNAQLMEIAALLDNCTKQQQQCLVDIMKAVKTSMDNCL